MTPRIGGLFFGYGGLDQAVQSVVGGELAWVSEFDKGANKIIGHRYPNVPNLGDITKIDWADVEPVDVITGGSPCQDLSHAGKRDGMTQGTRSNLWVSMREAIAVLRPPLVVWENVRGAYSAEADSEMEPCQGCLGGARDRGPSLRALGRVLGDLSDLGYDCGWHGLRAADVGAPHGRFRVFVVACLVDAQGNPWRLQHRDGGAATDTGQRGRGRRTPEFTWAPDDTAGRSAGPGTLLPTPTSSDTNGAGAHGDGGVDLRTAVSLLPTPSATDGSGAMTPEARAASGEGYGPALRDVGYLNWGIYADAINRWEHLTRPAPAPTQPSKKGTPQLSPAFSEWLMGLPAGWVTDVPGITRNEALKALGNGVCPPQAAAALRFLLKIQERAA